MVGEWRIAPPPARELLPQPGGFEGFGSVEVVVHMRDLPVTKRQDRVYALSSPIRLENLSGYAEGDDNPVSRIDELFGLRRRARLVVEANGPFDLLASTTGFDTGYAIPGDVRAEHGKRLLKVAALEGLETFPDHLHVLLRHRLLPHPGGFEGSIVPRSIVASAIEPHQECDGGETGPGPLDQRDPLARPVGIVQLDKQSEFIERQASPETERQ